MIKHGYDHFTLRFYSMYHYTTPLVTTLGNLQLGKHMFDLMDIVHCIVEYCEGLSKRVYALTV